MRPQSVEAAIAQARRVAALLRSDGAVDLAVRLESCVTQMTARYPAKEALLTIGCWCHAKGLGEAIQSDGWLDEVDRLRDCCVRAFNELEEMLPDPKPWV